MAAPSPPLDTPSPALQALASDLDDLVAAGRVRLHVVTDDGWGDPCGMCPEPRHGGPEFPAAAIAYIRREFTVGTSTAVYRDPVCGLCLWSAVRWEITYRRADVVLVDLIEVA